MAGSREQRLEALGRANEVRVERAKLKAKLKARVLRADDLLAEPPAVAEGMKLREFLESVPKVGKVKADRILRQTHSSHLTLGRAGERTRREVARRLPS